MPRAARPRCALPLSVSVSLSPHQMLKAPLHNTSLTRANCCRVNICGIAAGGEQYVLQRDAEYGAEAIFVKSAYALVDALPQAALLLTSQP